MDGEPIIQIYPGDTIENMDHMFHHGHRLFDLIYADMVYDNDDLAWMWSAMRLLKFNGIFMVQTDFHTDYSVKLILESLGLTYVNDVIYLQEWGGTSQRWFPRKHDVIYIYAKGTDYKFYPDRVQIPKATAGTKLDKKGTGLKTPCDVFYDLGNFMTTSKERIKINGHNVKWQKPLKLMERLFLPFTDEGDWILDSFLGTGSSAAWAKANKRNLVGIDNDPVMVEIAKERIR